MQIILYTLLLSLTSIATLQAQSNTISIDSVAFHVFSKYELNPSKYYYSFAHKPQGWFLQRSEIPNLDVVDDAVCIWNATSKTWQELKNYTKNENPFTANELITNNSLALNYNYIITQSNQFNVNLYYGYQGWDWDVINTLQKVTNTSPKEKEQLARAYSNYAMGFYTHQYGFAFKNDNPYRNPLKATDIVHENRADSFLFYTQKSIQQYELLYKQDKTYTTPVGNIIYKLNNEKVYCHFTLSLMGYSNKSTTILQSIQYPDSTINRNTSFLDKCTPNSITFCYGDNDTYILYYLLQTQETYKNKTTLINTTLLNDVRYAYALKTLHPSLQFKIPFSIVSEHDYIPTYEILKASDDGNVTWNECLKQIVSYYDNQTELTTETSTFKLLKPINYLQIKYKHKKDIDIPTPRFINRNQYLIYDILQQHNEANTNIYCTKELPDIGIPSQYYQPFDSYFQLNP